MNKNPFTISDGMAIALIYCDDKRYKSYLDKLKSQFIKYVMPFFDEKGRLV